MKRGWSILISLWSLSCLASIPTVEGLFRNAHNAKVEGNTAAVSFTIESEKKPRPQTLPGLNTLMQPGEDLGQNESEEFEKKMGHYKLIFTIEENKLTPMLQVRYNSVGMQPSDVVDTFVVGDFESHVKREKVLEKQFFYSLVQMFVLNSSAGFDSLLSRHTSDYRSNEDLIDPEKKRLYQRYMTYLKEVKDQDEDAEEKLESPLKPEDEKEREKVEKIKARRFYMDTGNVQLVREGEKFYWEVQLSGMRGLFTQEEHRLKELRLDTLQGSLEVSVANYVLMDGSHELPQKIILDHPEYGRYKVTFLSTQDFESKNTSFSERVQEYRDWQERNLGQKAQQEREALDQIPYMY